jgi:pimeloyl-ACP methyl ester carboxylesterase
MDVLAAVRHLRGSGAEHVYVLGASLGGWAAAEASILAPGEIDRLVLLAAPGIAEPERLTGRKLFIVTEYDTSGSGVPRLVSIRDQHARAPDPKELIVLDGDVHAQAIFNTDQGAVLLAHILRFLNSP